MNNEPTNAKLDALKHLSETHRVQHNERRKHEWKIVITVLTFYVLAVWARINAGSGLTINLCFVLLTCFFVLALAAATSALLGFLTLASNANKVIAEKAEAKIHKIAGLQPPEREIEVWTSWRNFRGRSGRWGWIVQTVLLFLFSIMAALLLTTKTLDRDGKIGTDTILGTSTTLRQEIWGTENRRDGATSCSAIMYQCKT